MLYNTFLIENVNKTRFTRAQESGLAGMGEPNKQQILEKSDPSEVEGPTYDHFYPLQQRPNDKKFKHVAQQSDWT